MPSRIAGTGRIEGCLSSVLRTSGPAFASCVAFSLIACAGDALPRASEPTDGSGIVWRHHAVGPSSTEARIDSSAARDEGARGPSDPGASATPEPPEKLLRGIAAV